ncbi:hypothetical protein C8A00DRAFT_28466 [Chaetomidium leptoderma]|uniref:C2H2-type domain-containing protein n=1 Tax=Chaetomidium leptoderma TaxID=669021 RepID=A0AAN6VXP0_9PEZI|nr:hypothetical protein C8A00DRAFT_28466 [Chaetomidium leptoderma]
MSSTYTLYPPGPDTTTARRDQLEQPRSIPTQDPQYLNPFSPQLGTSTHTPAEAVSPLSVHYQSSEFSEADDLFFGVNFNSLEGASPSFLDDDILQFDGNAPLADSIDIHAAPTNTQHVRQAAPYLPLSPDKSPSLQGGSPNGRPTDDAVTRGVFSNLSRTSVAPRELSLKEEFSPAPVSKHTSFQLTPKTNGSAESSDDGLAQASAMQSPRVTVSHWDRDNTGGPGASNDGLGGPAFSTTRDATGQWIPNQATGQSGLDPVGRSATQIESINDLASQRKLDERNQEVDNWLESSAEPRQPVPELENGNDNIPEREIAMGHMTENKYVPGQTYYAETGGELTHEDVELMRQGRPWNDAPVSFSVFQSSASTSHQPQSSQAAMEKYQRMCRDNDSFVSRAATWGTRRFSLPSMDADVQVAGNLLKKLSLSRGHSRRPSLLEGIRSLVRKPSVSSTKRNRPEPDDASSFMTESSMERKESQATLAPPSPKPGWTRKQSVPSINTAFVDVGSRVASIGTTHARTGSVSATPVTSPRSPSGRTLSVKRPLNRLRSKSETSGIIDLWKRDGGPPVSNLPNTKVHAPEADDDEDDEDDLYEDADMKAESTKLIDDVAPNFQGFQQHVLKLNPLLGTANNFLVDRIAHQQCLRYKNLLRQRVSHLQAIAARNCSCGSMCIALGGSANILDSKNDQRGLDPLSTRYDGSDGDITPLEGAINPDSFPQDIPMPPTSSLPSEFECQLCFTAKKFQKPSDWTKHVHEDVQPFTCTWERCREPKMFKRKADWVRHENEGHRHLEWWTCDVDDCRHKCFRRDNFLQHLVREHKYVEPKVKTKAAIKRAGSNDPTWAKVEQCHQETRELPQHEPCRFCGKTFPSWKKLTVHLAKHMEHISLPVLKLVAKKDLDEDSIISPVQDPPPRQFPTSFPTTPDQHHFGPSPTMPQGPMSRQPGPMAYPNPAHQAQALGMYPPSGYPANLYSPNYGNLSHDLAQAQINMSPMGHHHQHHHQTHGFQSLNSQAAFPSLPVTSAAGGYMTAPLQTNTTATTTTTNNNNYMTMAPDIEPFPALSMDALGLVQDPIGTLAAPGQMSYVVGGGMGMDPNGGVPMEHQHQHQHQHQQHQHPHQQQFTPQGSVSPFGHSPNMPQNGFF